VCRAVSRQQLGKHIPVATDTHAITKVLLETVFSAWSMQRGYKEDNRSKNSSVRRELPFREDLCLEAKEQPLLEPFTRK
jgi:hypothetical protein